MLYKNKKTGEVIDFACTVSGGAWELVEAPAPATVKEAIIKKPVKKTVKKTSK